MRKLIQKYFLLIVILLINANILPQSLSDLERRYYDLDSKLKKENHLLDSLKLILENKGRLIDIEKKRADPDKEKIISQMASSASLSNRIENQQKKVSQLNKEAEVVKKEMDKKYTVIIDSLKTLKASGDYKESESELESNILFYTERKLLISPKLLQLSFHPEKILKLDLNNSKSTKEKILYREYLHNALKEVSAILVDVEEISSEVDQIIALQRKTKKFLEEAEFDDGIKQPRLQSSEPAFETTSEVLRFTEDNAALTSQVQAYSLILNQLSTNPMADTKFIGDTYFNKKNIDIREYKELLDEVKKKLNDYKLVLSNKIGIK